MGNNLKLKKYYAEKCIKIADVEIKSKYWGGNRQLTMEVINVLYFTN